MEVIMFEKESFYKLIDELTQRNIRAIEKRYSLSEWVNEMEAKDLLGIKSKNKLRGLMDDMLIEFSRFGKTIRYSRSSIMKFLENHRVTLDKLVTIVLILQTCVNIDLRIITKKSTVRRLSAFFSGGKCRIRTYDPLLVRQVL
jgi:hypothetical protein